MVLYVTVASSTTNAAEEAKPEVPRRRRSTGGGPAGRPARPPRGRLGGTRTSAGWLEPGHFRRRGTRRPCGPCAAGQTDCRAGACVSTGSVPPTARWPDFNTTGAERPRAISTEPARLRPNTGQRLTLPCSARPPARPPPRATPRR